MKQLKKILIIIMLLCPYIVKASTYDIASDPYYVTEVKNQEEVLEEEKRYKFYKEEKIYSDEYYIEGDNPVDYPYISDNYIITDYTEFSKNYPENPPNRIIKSRDVYLYKTLKKIRYINIKDIIGSNGYLNINEINIKEKDKNIPYTIDCQNCQNINNIFDEKLDNYAEIKNNETIIIDLKDYYNIENLTLNIYISDQYGTDTTSFKIDSQIKNYIDIFIETNMYTKNNNSYLLSFNLKDYIKEEFYEEEIYSDKEIDNENYYLVDKYKEYSYQDIKYLYYKINKNYLLDYYKEKEGYLKDENDYKIYYKVRYKNKIKLKDDYIIKSRKYNLYDMIEDTTIDVNDITIENNIDINKNGLYKVSFKYDNKVIDTYVIVDIEEVMESISFSDKSDIKKAKIINNELKNKNNSNNKNKVSISLILYSFLKIFRLI